MGQLIDDLLRLSKVSRGEMTREPVNLGELAARVANELEKRSGGHAPAVTIEPALVAMGDPRLLRILLENLLDNAWKFTGRQRNAQVEIGSRPGPDGSTTFYVRDNGVGFDASYAAKLFAPFQRLHDASDFPEPGSASPRYGESSIGTAVTCGPRERPVAARACRLRWSRR